MNKIITIAREAGSGGSEAAHILAEMLGVTCYDKNLIAMAAKKSGLSEEALHLADEKAASSLLYSFVMGSHVNHNTVNQINIPLNDRLFNVQSSIIRELAEAESCVIVGRCADYVLASHPSVVRVFIHGDFEGRVKRVAQLQDIKESEARDTVIKADKRRSNYYNYYTGQKWGRTETYDLSVCTDKIGPEGAAKLIMAYAKIAFGE